MNRLQPKESVINRETPQPRRAVFFQIERGCQHEKEALMNVLTGITACSQPVELQREEKIFAIDIADWIAENNMVAIQRLLSELPIVSCKIIASPVKRKILHDNPVAIAKTLNMQNGPKKIMKDVQEKSDEDTAADNLVSPIENERLAGSIM